MSRSASASTSARFAHLPDRVEVGIRPSGHLTADVLVGADGVHSRIRDLVFGDGGLWNCALGFDTAAFSFRDEHIEKQLEGRLHGALRARTSRRGVPASLRPNCRHVRASKSGSDAAGRIRSRTLQDIYRFDEVVCAESAPPRACRAGVAIRACRCRCTLTSWHRGRIGLAG